MPALRELNLRQGGYNDNLIYAVAECTALEVLNIKARNGETNTSYASFPYPNYYNKVFVPASSPYVNGQVSHV